MTDTRPTDQPNPGLPISDNGVVAGALAGTPVGTWNIDPMHSAVTFAVRHLMSKVTGRFTDVEGRILLGSAAAATRVEATIAMASIATGVPMRDEDLRSPNFFDSARFPTMRFEGSEVTEDESGIRMAGTLTIRDVTQAIVLDVEFLGLDETGLQGEPRIGFVGRTTLYRSDFGVGQGPIDGGKVVVGDAVHIELDVEAYLQP